MFLSRFIHPKPNLHFRKIGFPQPIRWRYSTSTSTKPESEKRSTALMAQKASAVESFVKKYMESHPGIFSSVTLVRNKVGGSWYTLRDIVLNLKETMSENPQVQINHPSSADAASYFISSNKGEVDASESTEKNTLSSKSNISSSAIAISGKTLSEKTKDVATISGAIKTCNDSSSNEPHQAESSVQPSTLVPALDSHVAEIKLSQASSSSITGECSSTKMLYSPGLGFTALAEPTCMVPMLESGESSLSNEKAPAFGDNASQLLDSKKLVDAKNDLFQLEELSELIREVSRDQKMKHQLTRALQDVAAEKSGSTESASRAESNFIALDAKRNLGSEIGESSGLSSQDLKGKGLAELLAKYVDDMPAVNPKQSVKAIIGSLSRFKTDRNLNSAQLPIDHFVPIESSKTLQKPSANVTNSTGYKIPQSDIQAESSELPGADFLLKRKDHPEARHKIMTDVNRDILTPNRLDDSSSSSQKEVVGKDSDISSLINCLKELPPTEQSHCVPYGNTNFTSKDRIRSRDLMGEVQSQGKLQQYDNKKRQTVLKGQPVVKKREKESGLEISSKVSQATKTKDEESGDVAAVSAFDNIKSTSSAKGSLLTSENDFNKASVASSIEQVLDQNKALLRFLPEKTEVSDIAAALKNHNDITKIEFSSVKKCKLKTALVYFKTRDKLQEALKRKYLFVGNRNATITIEAVSSLDSCKLPDRICIPNLIGDPGAPVVLLKNPTKTVMIKDLTDDMSSHHIQEALLAFCKSRISGFFLGSSTSVAYVEFETEEGKDRALSEHLIFVQGKPLSIFRVDAPRTTVIRISGPQKTYSGANPLVNLCNSFGKVKATFFRCSHVADVHYDISEWANMLKILNGLNGMLLDGHKLQAQAAPVFPPEVILALWNQPEERRRLKGLMQKLMQKLQQSDVDITALVELGARYYEDDEL